MERFLRDQRFCALAMDGSQGQSPKLFITNIVLSMRPVLGLTNSIETVGVMDYEILCKIVVANLDDLLERGINISAITCDGASYQVKALNFKDPASIQQQNRDKPYLFKLLFVPCLCHRLNNAYQSLYRNCGPFTEMITSLRRIAVFCRKPEHRLTLTCSCPTFIPTRWIYDKRLLDFMLDHKDTIATFTEIPYAEWFERCRNLITVFYDTVKTLDGRLTGISRSHDCD
jgi:hypothetical protein